MPNPIYTTVPDYNVHMQAASSRQQVSPTTRNLFQSAVRDPRCDDFFLKSFWGIWPVSLDLPSEAAEGVQNQRTGQAVGCNALLSNELVKLRSFCEFVEKKLKDVQVGPNTSIERAFQSCMGENGVGFKELVEEVAPDLQQIEVDLHDLVTRVNTNMYIQVLGGFLLVAAGVSFVFLLLPFIYLPVSGTLSWALYGCLLGGLAGVGVLGGCLCSYNPNVKLRPDSKPYTLDGVYQKFIETLSPPHAGQIQDPIEIQNAVILKERLGYFLFKNSQLSWSRKNNLKYYPAFESLLAFKFRTEITLILIKLAQDFVTRPALNSDVEA